MADRQITPAEQQAIYQQTGQKLGGYTPPASSGSSATSADKGATDRVNGVSQNSKVPNADGSAYGTKPGQAGYVAPQNTQNNGTPTPYYSRINSSAGTDSNYNNAQDSLNPTVMPTEESFYAKIYGQLAPVLDAIQKSESAAELTANVKATQQTSATNAALGARGLAGSSEGDSMASQVETERNAAIADAKAQQATKVGELTKWAIPQAYTQYQDALTRNDVNSQNYITTKQTQAKTALAGIASQGIPLDQFKTDHPEQYNQLLQYFNGDENALTATYIANIPAPNMIGDPVYNGTKATFLYLDPITKTYKSSTVDTGSNVDGKNTVTKVVPGVGVVIVDQNTGAARVVGGTSNPYYMANQALTAESKSQTINSRKALIASRLIGSQIKSDGRIQGFLQIATPWNRLQANIQDIHANGINVANASDLLDSMVKINTGGQAITAGQVGLLNDSKSFADQAKVLQQKITGSGGVIDQTIADQISELATKTYGLYQGQFQQAAAQYNARLKNVPGEGDLSGYSPLTDITQISSVLDGSYAQGLSESLGGNNGGTADTSGLPTDSAGNPVSVGSKVSYTDENGNSVEGTVDAVGNINPD